MEEPSGQRRRRIVRFDDAAAGASQHPTVIHVDSLKAESPYRFGRSKTCFTIGPITVVFGTLAKGKHALGVRRETRGPFLKFSCRTSDWSGQLLWSLFPGSAFEMEMNMTQR